MSERERRERERGEREGERRERRERGREREGGKREVMVKDEGEGEMRDDRLVGADKR